MNRPVLVYPNPTLRLKSLPVDPSELTDPDFLKLIADLQETLAHAKGAAISAIQVGVPKRVIVVSPELEDLHGGVFINPVLVSAGSQWEEKTEGCLSMPGIFAKVLSPVLVNVSATKLDGSEFFLSATGDLAQALYHELEHLEGKLLIDKVKPVKKEMINRRSKKHAGQAILYR